MAAACLYIICRQDSKPFMLIDFSDALQLNVFLLGAVFMSLCKALHMEELPMFQRCAGAAHELLSLPRHTQQAAARAGARC